MNPGQSKFFSIVCLGVGSIFFGLLPLCFAKRSQKSHPLLLSCLLCFGGGVLMSTSLTHILPEVRESAKKEYKSYTEILFCAGFFVLYLMDEAVHFIYGESGHSHGENAHGKENNNGHLCEEDNLLGVNKQRYQSSASASATSSSRGRRHSTNGGNTHYGAVDPRFDPSAPPLRVEQRLTVPYNPAFFRARSDSILCYEEVPSQICHVGHQEPCKSSLPIANLGLLVALSLHSILEGLVVGLEDESAKVLLLLGAIASHKLVVGFCLGAELASNPDITFCKHFICILVFSGASLMGILLGMLITQIPSSVNDIAIPILQALAGGTLLYVTVSEVLPRERARWHQKHGKRVAGMVQLLSVISGFALMTVFSQYLGEN